MARAWLGEALFLAALMSSGCGGERAQELATTEAFQPGVCFDAADRINVSYLPSYDKEAVQRSCEGAHQWEVLALIEAPQGFQCQKSGCFYGDWPLAAPPVPGLVGSNSLDEVAKHLCRDEREAKRPGIYYSIAFAVESIRTGQRHVFVCAVPYPE